MYFNLNLASVPWIASNDICLSKGDLVVLRHRANSLLNFFIKREKLLGNIDYFNINFIIESREENVFISKN